MERNIGYICFQSLSTKEPPDKIIWEVAKNVIRGPNLVSLRGPQNSAFLSYFLFHNEVPEALEGRPYPVEFYFGVARD